MNGGDLVEEETGLRYEPQHPPQLEAAGVGWEASRGGTLTSRSIACGSPPGKQRLRSGSVTCQSPLLSSGSLGDVVLWLHVSGSLLVDLSVFVTVSSSRLTDLPTDRGV
ncbi:unnamed protein product [Pleuronectes platessa]|uniref:Uncharacterized protein n=1 Tax=Pleuronectes platessa TaxID=8262 RepID=A0A9N7VB68_PLEPL|nr:unnamed protein product [Pleuronectes platessa]